MKRRDLIRHLEAHGCVFVREGGSHTVYANPARGKVSTILDIERSMTTLRGRFAVISKSQSHKTPNNAFERTAASALRPLAVPFSLRSSAAAQRDRWASDAESR